MLASILTLAVTDLLTLIQYQSFLQYSSILQNMLYMLYKLLQRYTRVKVVLSPTNLDISVQIIIIIN